MSMSDVRQPDETTDQYETRVDKRMEYLSGFSRDDERGKPRYDLIPPSQLKRLAELYARGVPIHGERNWEKATGDERDRFRRSAFRHFMQWFDGDVDEDHAAAVVFNVFGWEATKPTRMWSEAFEKILQEAISFGVPSTADGLLQATPDHWLVNAGQSPVENAKRAAEYTQEKSTMEQARREWAAKGHAR